MSSAIKTNVDEGSVLGGVLLLAGSCIGAGMLALPVITGIGGFFPSLAMFIFAWLFMTATGLLLLEANLAIGSNLSLISIAEKTLGKTGKIFTWLLFLFLFYSLSIAYISASGSILQSIIQDLFGTVLPSMAASIFFAILFGVILFIGTKQVDYVNRLLMLGLILSYIVLVMLGLLHIKWEYLLHGHLRYAFAAIPVLIVSFGFHNMIPSVAMYMKGNRARLRITVLAGSFIPLLIYLIWELVMLGLIPVNGIEGLLHALDQGEAATNALRRAVGNSWINTVAQCFALFAIVTSFLAQSLSLVDFLGDGLKVSKKGKGRFILVCLAIVPPLCIAFFYPGIFIRALNLAGGFSAVILFGIMPALMVWQIRYRRKLQATRMLFGGKLLLAIILFFALSIFLFEALQELGFSLIPSSVEAIP